MVMVTIALVMAVIVTNIYAKKESPDRAPAWCIAIVSRFYPAYFGANSETGSRSTKANWKRKSKSSTANCSVQLLRPFPVSDANEAAGNGVPEVVTETGNEIRQRAHNPSGNGNGSSRSAEAIREENRLRSASEDNRADTNDAIMDRMRLSEKHERHRYELEWKMVAKFTDRVFFWVFLVLSVCVQVVLFLQVVPVVLRK